MSGQAQFSVYSTGHSSINSNVDTVRRDFAKLFGVSEEKADRYFQAKKLIRKGLSQEQALAYQKNLKKIGMPTLIEPAIALSPAINDDTPIQSISDSGQTLSLLPADAESPESSSSANAHSRSRSFTCPKCGAEQQRSAECIKCGVFFDKLQERAGSQQGEQNTLARSSNKRSSSQAVDNDGNTIVGIGAAMILALMLAFAWKLIAIQTGYEFGIVAWLAGGAIGYVALLAGARGEVPAVICALLTALAIFGGKYMTESHYLANVNAMFDGEMREELQADLDDYQAEIAAYQQIEHDDYKVKRFMSDYGYTNASSVTDISDAEMDDFRVDMAYTIEEMQNMPDVNETLNQLQAVVEEEFANESTFSSTVQNFGLLGIVFLFLGVGTAYRVVRQG